MFFYASKILWVFAAPSNFLLLLAVIGCGCGFTRFVRFGRRLAMGAALALAICGLSPLGLLLLAPLEARFPVPKSVATAPIGVIVLGGGVDEVLTLARDQVTLTEAGARMTEAAALARRFPQARLVFSGGSAALGGSAATESDAARRLWTELGIAPERMSFEDRSRNTAENAAFTLALVQPKPGEVWLLVTSAFHMPRSVGIFRQVGFDVTPWPVDFRTMPWPGPLRPHGEASLNLRLVDVAVREWIGLAAYWATGRSNALLPGP